MITLFILALLGNYQIDRAYVRLFGVGGTRDE